MITQSSIAKIFDTARIEEVIGDFVHLKKAGANYKGLSPFKQEKTASFVVSPSKQIFKCFASGKGGNVVTFLMDHEQMSYPEALKFLAKRYNIDVEETQQSDEQVAERKKREELAIIMNFAERFFQQQMLETDKGKSVAYSYFTSRGINDEQINKFKLGWCPDGGTALVDEAIKLGYSQDLLIELGLAKKFGEKLRDFYTGRVIFPISTVSGQVVAFAGRILSENKKAPKYINSPETELYHKSKVLYGIHQARTAIAKDDLCFLTEGYTDVLALEKAGVSNAVASSGTALTKEQAYLIRRYTKNVCLLYDGDEAGKKAALRGIDILLEQGLTVELLTLPDNHDPDSFAKAHGDEALKKYTAEKRIGFIQYKAALFLDGVTDPIKKSEGIRNLVESLSKVEDQILRSLYIKQFADKYDLGEDILTREIAKVRKKEFFKTEDKKAKSGPDTEAVDFVDPFAPDAGTGVKSADPYDMAPIEEELLRLLLLYGKENFIYRFRNENEKWEEYEYNVADFIIETLTQEEFEFDYQLHQKVLNLLVETEPEKISVSVIFSRLSSGEQSLVSSWLANDYEISAHWQEKHAINTNTEQNMLSKAVPESVYAFLLRKVKSEIKKIQDSLAHEQDFDEVLKKLDLQKKYQEAKKTYALKLERVVLH